MTLNIDQLGALFHQPWIRMAGHPEIIEGQWAEDGSTFEIEMPSQLVPLMIALQNKLHERYAEIQKERRELSSKEGIFEKLLR